MHEFSITGQLNRAAPDRERPDVRAITYPFDPVLRLALISAGVVTPEQLANAEATLRASGGAVVESG